MATHSSILAWKIPWREELGGLQSMGSQELATTLRLKHRCSPTMPLVLFSSIFTLFPKIPCFPTHQFVSTQTPQMSIDILITSYLPLAFISIPFISPEEDTTLIGSPSILCLVGKHRHVCTNIHITRCLILLFLRPACSHGIPKSGEQ